MAALSSRPFMVLRRVLRRWLNASRTTRSSSRWSLAGNGSTSCGTRRTIAESTFGGGLKAPGPTLNRCSTRQLYCTMIDKRPQSPPPGPAAMRSTTSFCSMKCMSRISPAWLSRWKISGVEML
ncbi:hypothetical protein D3C71_1845630 [compost metagenome]